MNWLQALYETYDNCSDKVGNLDDPIPLVPVAHIPQNTQIEITLTEKGEFVNATVAPLIIPIPCTEKSTGRTVNDDPHPLCDKLQYLASDYYVFTGLTEKKGKNHHKNYKYLLGKWAEFPHSHPFVKSVYGYIESNNGCVIKDLVDSHIFFIDDKGLIPNKWDGEKEDAPELYLLTKNKSGPWDVFVRWRVVMPGRLENRTYADKEMWDSWIEFEKRLRHKKGFCYLTGNKTRVAEQHPRFIRQPGDGAKIISSNDKDGYTFRGRFTDKTGDQVCGLGFDVSQKAHSALRWLIAKQGRRDGDQVIVTWTTRGKELPDIWAASDDFFGGKIDENPVLHVETGQEFAQKLKKAIGGYRAEIDGEEVVNILALDSATSGRICLTYYRHLGLGEFLERLNCWHSETAWHQNFGKDRKFIGAPAPKDIAQCAYGTRLDSKLLSTTYRRILPCIVDGKPVPRDLIASCVRRAIARHGMESWEWEKALGIACALYRKSQIEQKGVDHAMSLDRTRKTRSYLYGRLLAFADVVEQNAHGPGESRPTNASRFMQRFADRPLSTWRILELQLKPYEHRLLRDKPGLLAWFKQDLEETMELFDTNDFNEDSPLSGEFLLGFHNQRTAMRNKRTDESNHQETNDKEEE